ncbi:dTDP-4-dehydrorhamnose reductase [Usitatibacter rugosus]|uniref:dTDP-4-dehydrorhamnose reductase n=1 Tax=Usitatibacter rugosus TaxID=2732067 RepID=A0A6M4GQF2_9PROT|nr:dTDP-4-dehydrorhamnose reductase [Usitatibacter rugosus]QJR09028.1 dTDP-4-dehydrorhamnose reductase [Usitatibacter rugosus]
MNRVLVTGAAGQVGAAVAAQLRGSWEVIAHDRASLDLADPARIAAVVAETRPDVIVNAGAYTAVDRAETDTQAALAANSVAPGAIGIAAKHVGAVVIHFSTDYVFDGTKATPYVESDPTSPVSVYGASKLTGERALAASGVPHVILRTSWVYGPRGKNFLLTMLNAAKTREEVRVVDDQRGAPTSALQLARATQALLAQPADKLRSATGVYHCSAAGDVTWFDFTREIYERWGKINPGFRAPRVVPIPSSEYPTPVKRPANSRLSNAKLQETFRIALEPWEQGLDETLAVLASA